MKSKTIIFLSLMLIFALGACQNSKNETEVPYQEAKNYFVNNTVEKLDNHKITDQETFESIFGMATTMGDEGRPTAIDFSKEFAIAVVLPETQKQITLHPKKLTQDEKGTLTFRYSKEKGEDLTHTIKPVLIVIVDNQYDGTVKVKEE